MEKGWDAQLPPDERHPDWNFYDGVIHLHSEVGDERFDEAFTELLADLAKPINLDAPISSIYIKNPVGNSADKFKRMIQIIKEKMHLPHTVRQEDPRTIEVVLRETYSQYCSDIGPTYVGLIASRAGNIKMATQTGFGLDLTPKIMALANAAAVVNNGLAIVRIVSEEIENNALDVSAIITECISQEISEKVSSSTFQSLVESISRHAPPH